MDLVKKLHEIGAINYPTNDVGASSLYHAVFEDVHRYNQTAREWMLYDGAKWVIDKGGLSARNDAKRLWQALKKYAVQVETDEKTQKFFDDMVYRWGGARYRNAIINDAMDMGFVKNEDMDVDDYLLNVKNGTLDVNRVEFLSHSPSDFLSLVADVEYDSQASADRWEQFIDEIMEGDSEKSRYLQKLSGLCLTGDCKLEKMWFLYGGTTRNGKSTFIETLSDMLGDYAVNMRPESLAIRQNNDSRTASGDIARLAGKRLVVCSEPPKRMPLDVSLLKSMTGRDTLTARHLHQSEFEFVPKFKLLCNTNYLPMVQDMTVFKSDRIQVVSFNRHFDTTEQDLTLKDKLKKEKPGILNWCLEGLRMYYEEGLQSPSSVVMATEEYAGASDKLGNFISEVLTPCKGNNIAIKTLYEKYGDWCEDAGQHTDSKKNFIADLRTRGIFKERGYVDGKQVFNIIQGYKYAEDSDSFVEVPDELEVPFDG